MLRTPRTLTPIADRGPLRAMFLITSMPVGGAETLLVNLIRRMDRERFAPELCCLKQLGPLGEELAAEIPAHHGLLDCKYDVRVLWRLTHLLRQRKTDALITVGAGDKMFWGRLAAWRAGAPVVLSALHSTGWPDGIGRLNRLLTPITDAFIGVAAPHARHLVETEKFPAEKVRVIPNGVDTARFRANPQSRSAVRQELGIPADAPVCGIVAALRPEKNHLLFLRCASIVHSRLAEARFLIVGEGPERKKLEVAAASCGLRDCVHFAGSRCDIPEVLSAMDVFALTSHNEANPVSILEAMAAGLPVVSTRVGSIHETVLHEKTGFLADPGDASRLAAYWKQLLRDPQMARRLGSAGRDEVVANWSLERMVAGYEDLIAEIYHRKCAASNAPVRCKPSPDDEKSPAAV